MPFLAGVWTWLTNNKWAQYLAVFALAFIGMKRWEYNIRKGVERQEREKNARIAAEREAQIVSTITENSNEYVRASDSVRSHDVAVQLPDETGARLPDYHYRN